MIFTLGKGTDAKYRILYLPLDQPTQKPVHLVGEFEAEYRFIDNDGPVFWFKTNKNASRGKVIAIDTRSPNPAHWVEVIPEAAETLQGVDLVGDRFLAVYLKDADSVVRVFDLHRKHVRDVDLPGIGTADGFQGNAQGPRDVLRVHLVHLSDDHLSL